MSKHTPGPWSVVYYDAGDCDFYDHGGPCPSVQAPDEEDCAIIHWDGFKQKYWSSANGNQRQIEANAARIVACVNACEGLADPSVVPELVKALEIALDQLEGRTLKYGKQQAINVANAAIAKAKGEGA